MRLRTFFPQFIPHFDHTRLQLPSQLFVSLLRRLAFRRRDNRIAKNHFQRRKTLNDLFLGQAL